jgi:hypothetical protein
MVLTLERAMQKVWSAGLNSDAGPKPVLDQNQVPALRSGLVELLNSPTLWPDNKIFLTLQSRRAIQALEPEPGPGRDELVDAWLAVAEEIQVHPEYSATEQLMAFVPEFELLSLRDSGSDETVPASLQNKVRARVEPVISGAAESGEFQSTLNMLVWLHTMAGLSDEAAALLDEHKNQTAAPHYFLSILGDLSAEDPDTALEWHRLAFDQSGRGSSRVKWGTAYVQKLIQLAPDDPVAIETATREVISVLATSSDAFAGRNHAYLMQIDHALRGWADATDNSPVIDELRQEFVRQCDRFKSEMDESQYERCMAFLAGDPPTNEP